ncbi:uncharacterized protein LOC126895648 [Daktulosphaira vitifoliae]|uniref:uncharacterized protein LOC126895648 n=1 Tax=Daktulosphaira vitifoliae TaxID=58002 RepID=UPI0021AA1DD6|nr:uncharacterized protein LOC126895648 [Daktulosphaira vitifoliae]
MCIYRILNKPYFIFTVLLICCLYARNIEAGTYPYKAKTMKTPTTTVIPETTTDAPVMARIFFSALGDFIEAVPVFPITLNVPDMVTAFSGLLSGMVGYITGSNDSGESKPKDILRVMAKLYRTIAVQEDLHDIEFLT